MSGRIVFLYSELAGYVLACLRALAAERDVAVMHWPVNPEAPFALPAESPLGLRDRSGLSRADIAAWVDAQEPVALVVSGWMDADYVAVARRWRRRVPVVLTLDNPWRGDWKQWAAVLASPVHVRRVFNRVWVPGEPQRAFARRLGAGPVAEGMYCADVHAFDAAWAERAPQQRLLYVGRYLPFKGVEELWAAFEEVAERHPGWELHAVGSGAGWDARRVHPAIVHHGFLQPEELAPLVASAAAFVMPSHKEPWGVVLHEMAAAGVPLIASDAVGAATRFLVDGENGYVFPAGDAAALAEAMERMITAGAAARAAMGERSRERALAWTPERWARTLMELMG